MVEILTRSLPDSWEAAKRKNTRTVGVTGNIIAEPVSNRLAEAWNSRDEWMAEVGPKIVHDMRTPVMGEEADAMVYSDSDADGANYLMDESDLDLN